MTTIITLQGHISDAMASTLERRLKELCEKEYTEQRNPAYGLTPFVVPSDGNQIAFLGIQEDEADNDARKFLREHTHRMLQHMRGIR